jgi:hypothetical protein
MIALGRGYGAKRILPRLLRTIRRPISSFKTVGGTTTTAGFEFRMAWEALRPGGILIANSVDRSVAFASRVRDVSRPSPSRQPWTASPAFLAWRKG